jgi:hypothetical protein
MGKDSGKRNRIAWRVLQLAGTALAFKLASDFASRFSQPEGASFLFPPAGISLAAGAAFGLWGVAGVLLGVVASPWGMAAQLPGLLLSCCANGLSAALPAWFLRRPQGGTGRRLRRTFFSGALLNNLLSAVIGTLGLVALGRLAATSEASACRSSSPCAPSCSSRRPTASVFAPGSWWGAASRSASGSSSSGSSRF